jgi:hypothetical protein
MNMPPTPLSSWLRHVGFKGHSIFYDFEIRESVYFLQKNFLFQKCITCTIYIALISLMKNEVIRKTTNLRLKMLRNTFLYKCMDKYGENSVNFVQISVRSAP